MSFHDFVSNVRDLFPPENIMTSMDSMSQNLVIVQDNSLILILLEALHV